MKFETKKSFIKTVKIAFGAGCSIAIANVFCLSFGAAAGIITLLTIQDTKKETLEVVLRRIIAFVMALVISYVIFNFLFGYSAISFAIFLFIFVMLCNIYHLEDGISLSAVLITHFLSFQQMGIPQIANEIYLLVIGAGIGTLLNLYMLDNQKEIRENQRFIESRLREVFFDLAEQLKSKDRRNLDLKQITELEQYIKKSMKYSYETSRNVLFSEAQYFLKYMELRKYQCEVIQDMFRCVSQMNEVVEQANELAGFVEHIAHSLHESNNGELLILEFCHLRDYYKNSELPESREEFENRALLYFVLLDLEKFLKLKVDFVAELSEEEIQKYW